MTRYCDQERRAGINSVPFGRKRTQPTHATYSGKGVATANSCSKENKIYSTAEVHQGPMTGRGSYPSSELIIRKA